MCVFPLENDDRRSKPTQNPTHLVVRRRTQGAALARSVGQGQVKGRNRTPAPQRRPPRRGLIYERSPEWSRSVQDCSLKPLVGSTASRGRKLSCSRLGRRHSAWPSPRVTSTDSLHPERCPASALESSSDIASRRFANGSKTVSLWSIHRCLEKPTQNAQQCSLTRRRYLGPHLGVVHREERSLSRLLNRALFEVVPRPFVSEVAVTLSPQSEVLGFPSF